MGQAILVLGTRNLKKRRELESLLDEPRLELRTLDDYPNAPEVEETGTTFLQNATLKAETVARAIGAWVLAEDSGLCVEALAGGPGIYSARYAGEPCDDEGNNDKLLSELEGVPDEGRSAYYVCEAVLADPTGKARAAARGTMPGQIIHQRRGTGGFGYDPLFLIPEEGKTLGELPPEYKRAHSHRSQALRRIRQELVALLCDTLA